MRKIRLAALVAALTIIWLGGCTPVNPVPPAKTEPTAAAADPAGKAGATAPGPSAPTLGVTPGTYMARTVWKKAPLTNVRVEWRHRIDDAVPTLSGVSSRFGTTNFRPQSGSYYLTADWRQDGDFTRPRKPGDRFGWYGGNPLLVSSEISEVITLLLVEVPPPPPPPSPLPAGSGVFGRVTLDNVPVADAGIYAFAKSGRGFKADDFQAFTRTNTKGEFTLTLQPEQYYLLARLRTDNSVDLGPLRKDDLLGYDPGNPVVVEQGRYTATAIPVTRLKMLKSRAESSTFRPGTIEGRIVDRDGRPVPGTYAGLYEKPSLYMDGGRPEFMSEPAGADGRFTLSVLVPGRYFLGARSGYGTPAVGGWFGAWGGSVDYSITIKTGEVLSGIEIVVDRLAR